MPSHPRSGTTPSHPDDALATLWSAWRAAMVRPGAAGENVSITGLDWVRVRPGVRLRLGDAVAEISAYATPRSKNNRWFDDDNS